MVATVAGNMQGLNIWRRHEELQVEDESESQHLGTNIFRRFPASPIYSHLGTVSSSHGLAILHGYLLITYRCGIRILSGMVWSQGGADYTASTFRAGAPEWSCGTGF